MNYELSILIVEDDATASAELSRCIEAAEDMSVVASCDSSQKAMELARFHLPNVIILDLELHRGGGNGLMFLDNLLANPLSMEPFILVTTNNMSTVTLDQAKALGADFTLAKYEQGYSAQYVVDNLNMLRNAIRRKNTAHHLSIISPAVDEKLIRIGIQRTLDILGIKPKAKGYTYLTDAIYMVMNKQNDHISHQLAKKYGKSSTSIERAMQNAIKQAWLTNDIEVLLDHYGAPIRADKGYPTMMEFICYLAKTINMEVDMEKVNIEKAKYERLAEKQKAEEKEAEK